MPPSATPIAPDPRRASAGRANALRAMRTLAGATLAEAIHSRVIATALLAAIAAAAAGMFAASLALTDGAGIGAAVQGWLARIGAVFVLATFAVSSVVRDTDDKGLELVLSMPIPRSAYLLGKWAGMALAALALATLVAASLLPHAAPRAAAAWGASLFLELIIVASAGLLCAVTFASVVGSLAALAAFYSLARTMAAMIAIGHGNVAPADSPLFHAATVGLHGIAALLPRLDMYAPTAWLVTPGAELHGLPNMALQAAVYTIALLAAAAIDLSRKSV
ncbi:MAG: ABC transporter permease subunit [Burkholderiales bacterium]|nr:ABC transporter permease subunit [Burkholderiales bacterium]